MWRVSQKSTLWTVHTGKDFRLGLKEHRTLSKIVEGTNTWAIVVLFETESYLTHYGARWDTVGQ